MDLKPGDVVILKSGGHPMTVAEAHDNAVACLWMGGEGDLFRETIPKSKVRTKRTTTKRRTKKTKPPELE